MSLTALPSAVFFAAAGIIVFAVALFALLRMLPGQLWNRALEGDMAAALIVAALILALGWIVAASVH